MQCCLLQRPFEIEYLLCWWGGRKFDLKCSLYRKPKKTQNNRSLPWVCGSKIICICYYFVISSRKEWGWQISAVYSHKKTNFQTDKTVTKFRSKSINTFDPSTMKCFHFWDGLLKGVQVLSWVSWGWFFRSGFLHFLQGRKKSKGGNR